MLHSGSEGEFLADVLLIFQPRKAGLYGGWFDREFEGNSKKKILLCRFRILVYVRSVMCVYVWVCVCVGFVICGLFGSMCTCVYCVLYCLYCVFCIVSFMYIYSYLFCLY